jgi:hypothetical protein
MRRGPPHGDVTDATIVRLSPDERRLVAATCARRAELELRGAAAFTVVTQALIELGADGKVLALSAQAIAEELRHSEAYLELAHIYGGVALPAPVPAAIAIPAHGLPPRLERILHIVGMCSVNETMACAFLELCLAEAVGPVMQAALREVLGDEIKHARIGWAYLASARLDEDERQLIARAILPLVQMQWRGWREQLATLPSPPLLGHGCPSREAIEAAALEAIAELVLPGFEHVGFATDAARAWLPTAPRG